MAEKEGRTMSNPILIMKNAGHGETPVPDDALFKPGDTFEALSDEPGYPAINVNVLAVVPVGALVEYAIADQANPPIPRPLMLQERTPHEETLYVLKRDNDVEPSLFTHSQLLAGKQKAQERNALQ